MNFYKRTMHKLCQVADLSMAFVQDFGAIRAIVGAVTLFSVAFLCVIAFAIEKILVDVCATLFPNRYGS